MPFRCPAVSTLPTERPRNISASCKASIRLVMGRVVANARRISSKSSRSVRRMPFTSFMMMFSRFTPSSTYSFTQAMAAAPAPLTTILMSPMFFLTISKALSSAADEMMAVPCWSSCMTGMFICLRSSCSISKHSGALMSSRLMPPNVGSSDFTMRMNSCGSVQSISMSNTSMPANFLNSTPFPSMTGLEACGPMLPRPSTAVPFEITATKLPLAVYRYTLSWFSAISLQGSATPGE